MSGGPHPDDARAFAAKHLPILRAAVEEVGWLLGRGYPHDSAARFVGDRHQLSERQRAAVSRASASAARIADRQARRVAIDGQELWIDALNLLVTVERALGGGAVIRGADGCWRDVAGVHGTWRRSDVTIPAILEIAAEISPAASARWLIDAPVSNSGRLAALIREHQPAGASWTVEVVPSPDAALRGADGVAVTADAGILDRCGRWADVAGPIVRRLPGAFTVDLATGG